MRTLVAALLLLSLASCGPPSRADDHLPPSGNLATRAFSGTAGTGTGPGTGPGTGNTLLIQPATLPGGTNGTAYTATMTCSGSGASTPITWALASGSFPPGLTLSGSTTLTETLSGQPTTSGSFTFSVSATSGPTMATGMTSYTVTIQ